MRRYRSEYTQLLLRDNPAFDSLLGYANFSVETNLGPVVQFIVYDIKVA